ncbi:hypothetical protein [Thermaurantiacus sp.]
MRASPTRGLSARIKAAFLAALAETGAFDAAARRVGLARTLLLVERNRDPAFALKWDLSVSEYEALDARMKAGVLGVTEPQEGFPQPPLADRRIEGLIRWILGQAVPGAEGAGLVSRSGPDPGVRGPRRRQPPGALGPQGPDAPGADPAGDARKVEALLETVAARIREAEAVLAGRGPGAG